jgi:hypothetical protein
MTEEHSLGSDYDRVGISSERFVPTGRKRITLLRPCIFCEFVQDLDEFETLESKDEELILFHLKHEHGLDR